MGALDDPRGHESERLAFEAERAWARGERERARLLFAQAAQLEAQVALSIGAEEPRLRSVLAISAVALGFKAARYEEAAALAHRFLGSPGELTRQGHHDLWELLQQCLGEAEVLAQMGQDAEVVPLQVKLEGGLVRPGLAPVGIVRERQQLTSALLVRVAEWRLARPFRKRGDARKEELGHLQVFEAPALAASYGLRLYVSSAAQPLERAQERPFSQEVVETFLELARAAIVGPQQLGQRIQESDYRSAFMLGFRELAPDGDSVGQVSFSSPTWRFRAQPSVFHPEHRKALSQGLVQNLGLGDATRVVGRLMVISLRGKKPFIQVETEDRELVTFRLKKGAFDDTIGPKLNHRVVVLSEVKQGRYGASELFAADVSLEVPVEN
ncbi:hypothetical protein [Archangium sp.]|uniref:hypothetical protein n=1 Tax=Archangium sp. TaxID=1872627 RepID=UPI00286A06F3|nr:hypothetical protein [Archangium sp.]